MHKGEVKKMKMGKKSVMGISFMVGTLMFATTAFAEVSSKSGYEQAKDALKYSADCFSSKLQSYTVNSSIVVKDNGNIVSENDKVNKYDFSKHAEENTGTLIEANKPKIENYYYADKNTTIDYISNKDAYNVMNYNKPNDFSMVSNPFKGKQEGDLEKIADAIIGNLKDAVVVNPKDDGTKELSGSVSESQIPAIANALASYEIKSQYCGNNGNGSYSVFPNEISDLYVQGANEDMILNKDGLIQSASGSAQISCKDNKGKVHNLTFQEVVTVVDINTTKVNKPDLTGKKVQQSNDQGSNWPGDPQMFVGTYKNDIVIEKDKKFIKIGERTIDITSIDSKKIIGKYHEEYIKGYEYYSSGNNNCDFTANFRDQYNADVQSIDSKGNKLKGYISVIPDSPTIIFGFSNIENQKVLNDDQGYSRVFN
jgi:hypothetical protein